MEKKKKRKKGKKEIIYIYIYISKVMVMVKLQAKKKFHKFFVLIWLHKYYLEFKGLTQTVNQNEGFFIMFNGFKF
jgi:hypothetical protein